MDNGHADICKDQFLPFMADMLFFGDKEVILLHYKVWAWSALLPDWLWPTSGENKLKQPTHFQLAHFFYFALWLTPILKNLGFFVAFFLYYLASLLQDIIHGVKKGDCMSFRCQVWKRPTQSSASSSVQTWNHHLFRSHMTASLVSSWLAVQQRSARRMEPGLRWWGGLQWGWR